MPYNYIGPINPTGYGIASSELFKALTKIEDIGFRPIGQITPDLVPQKDIEKSISLFNPKNPTFCFWHLHDFENQVKDVTGKIVGYTTFEVDEFDPVEVAVLKKYNVHTASTWGKDLITIYNGGTPLTVIPHAYKATDSEEVEPFPIYSKPELRDVWQSLIAPVCLSDKALYLSTAGKFEDRKGHKELIEACISMSDINPIVLIAFVHNPFILGGYPFDYLNKLSFYPAYTKSGIKVYTKSKFTLILMPPTKTRKELHNALSKAEVYISPSKGEGWDLPLFEMMSHGMACAATPYTGHLEYCSSRSIIDIEVDPENDLVEANDGKFFHNKGHWYNVTKEDIEALISSLMINVRSKNYLNSLKAKAASATSRFSWQKSAEIVHNIMNKLWI